MRTLLVVAILAITATARADDALDEARRLEASLEYEQALAIVDRVLAQGGATPDRLAELHLLAGRLAAGLDRMALAEDHFARLLALRPGAMLPDGTSPKLTLPFEAVRVHAVPLRVIATVTDRAVTLATTDPLGLVAGVRVDIVDRAGLHAEVREPRGLQVAIPAGETAVEITALDASGNAVWVGPAPLRPRPRIAIEAPVTPVYARWSTWAITSGVALAGAGVCAWRLDADQNRWNELRGQDNQHDFSELRAVESRGRQWAIAADVGFGLAAAAAVVTAIAAITHLGTHRGEPVAITAGPGTIGVAGSF